ncbi:uncharacterized protein LOC126885389 [Diabrotica virgifera virgifera]|uniref:Suppressor protein SRP40-like n=1 Tax=Diabrotica virgifera virgifera TaxID=50390 RepID=A0ABM5KCJ1_DIAVI|nr:uncharacterized protein LOC126885389 [Diabrotica virgifera virgifera]
MTVDFENKENQKSPTIDETTGTEDEIGLTFTNNDVKISRECEKGSSSSSSSISTSSSSISVFDNLSGDPNYSSSSCSSSSDDSSDKEPPSSVNSNNGNQNSSNKRRSVKNPCPSPENVKKKRKRKISQVAKMMRNSGQSYTSIKIGKKDVI